MTDLPSENEIAGAAITEGEFRQALRDVRAYLAGPLGTVGTAASFLSTLGALGSGLQQRSGAYTATGDDRGKVISASGTWTLTLPTAGTLGVGWSCVVHNMGTGTITIDPTGSQTINGAATVRLAPQGGGILFSTGTAWELIGTGEAAQLLPDGSAATPALGFFGNEGLGLLRPGAQQLGISVDSVIRALFSATAIQLDLPVTGTAVQSSASDVTPGRLAKVYGTGGLFGFGLPAGGSLGAAIGGANGATTSGRFATDGSTTNLPGGGAGVIDVATGSDASTVHQVWRSDADGGTWHRYRSGGNWSAWQQLFDRASIIGTVAEDSGAVIEVGENANGRYWRFAGGLQLCLQSGLTATYLNASRLQIAATFPAGFTAGTVPLRLVGLPTSDGDFTDVSAEAIGPTRLGAGVNSALTILQKVAGAPAFTATSQIDNVSLITMGSWDT